MKNLLFTILLLLTSIGMQAQCGPGNPICSYGPVTVASGATVQLPSNGGLVPGFKFTFSSGSGTVVTAGCIGDVATGCVSLDSYSGGTTGVSTQRTRLERSFTTAMRELKQMQKERQ